jgi:hypothetical protein
MNNNSGFRRILFLFLLMVTGLFATFCLGADLAVQPRVTARHRLITDPGTGLARIPQKGSVDVQPASASIPSHLKPITDPGTNTDGPRR